MAKRKKKKAGILPALQQEQRLYSGAKFNRLTSDWIASSTSSDAEIATSLRPLRNRSRQLCRDNDYAKGVVRTLVNNVVGKGIILQSQVKFKRKDELDDRTNTAIESAWNEWGKAKYCHTAGKLCFADIERLIVRSLVESGEVLIRLVKRSFAGSPVPLALEIIEADQLNDDYTAGNRSENIIKMGVELDEWQRPIAYHLYNTHPGDTQFARTQVGARIQRITADQILHLFMSDRPGQTRGVPWFHSALQRLHHVGGYEEAEVIAARVQACVSGFIQSPDVDAFADGVEDDRAIASLSPGIIERLAPGETFQGFAPTRPNTGFDPFVRMMLRGVAAGLGVSYESLSRDFSNTSYSSARTALLDERDNYRVIQDWLVKNFHIPLYEIWLELAVMSRALDLPGFELMPGHYCKSKWTCRGWQWVDPMKEISANKEAVKAGLDTLTNLASQSGRDLEDILKERQRELEMAKRYGIDLDTTMVPQNSILVLPD